MDWFELKNWLELSTGLDRDSLHIYGGVGVQLVAAVILRRSLASPVPWFFVLVAALANEYYDANMAPDSLDGGSIYFDEAVGDIWNTLLLPSLLLMIARFWPTWLTGRSETESDPDKLESASPPV